VALLLPLFTLSISPDVFEAAASDSLNVSCDSSGLFAAALALLPCATAVIPILAVAITPVLLHLMGHKMLQLWPLDHAAFIIQINSLDVPRSGLPQPRESNRQVLPDHA
jgi:hypothetical protein